MPTGRPTLLVADDSVTIQKVVTLTFTDEGMDVSAVGNGDDAWRQLEAETPPDIVLADAIMPGLSGYELCWRIKNDSRFQHIPVLLLVGAFEPFNEAEARRVGANEILTKPFQSIRDLMSKVGSLLGASEASPEAETEEPQHETPRQTEVAVSDASHSPAQDAQAAVSQTAAQSNVDAQHETGGAQHGTSVQDNPMSDRHPAYSPNPAASFADLGADDEMIEQMPVLDKDDDMSEQTISAEAPFAASATHADDRFDQMSAGDVRAKMDEWSGGLSHSFAAAHVVGEDVMLAGQQQAFSTHVASVVAIDDALLDLGMINTPPVNRVVNADDLILDLDDINPPAPPAFYDDAPLDSAQGVDEPVPVEVIEQDAIPQHQVPMPTFGVEDESHPSREFIEPTVVPADEFVSADALGDYTDGSVEGDVAKPPAATSVEPLNETETMHPALSMENAGEDTDWQHSVSIASAAAAGEQLINPAQLSPEMIEAIARRAVEMLSEKVVREIAWEVVPQLAELLIKRRLDEERQK